MKNLLVALVAVGFMVGCGGDTAKTSTEVKKTTTSGSSTGGTKTTTEVEKKEVKEKTTPPSGSKTP